MLHSKTNNCRPHLNSKIKQQENGFTLIELLVTLAIIGILAAITIVNFTSYRQKAQDATAQSDIRNLATAEEGVYSLIQSYLECLSTTDCESKFSDSGLRVSFITEGSNYALDILEATSSSNSELTIQGAHRASSNLFIFNNQTGRTLKTSR